MRRTMPFLATLVLSSLAPHAVRAQWTGQRVRLTTIAAPSRWLVGTLVGQNADTLRVQVLGEIAPISVTPSTLKHLEIGGGRRRFTGPGAVHGLEFGALAGAVVALRGSARPCAKPTAAAAVCAELRTLAGTGVGGAVGALVGAAIGSLFKTERREGVTPRGASVTLPLAF